MLDQDEGAIPLPRASHPRSGLRAGPLSMGDFRAPSVPKPPLVLAVLLAAIGATLFVALQPSAEPVPHEPLVEAVSTRVDPIAFDEEARLRSDEPAHIQPAVAPAPAQPAAETENTSVFRLDNLPVLEADETSLGVDDALDALTVSPVPPAPPLSEPARRRTAPVAKKRPANPSATPAPLVP